MCVFANFHSIHTIFRERNFFFCLHFIRTHSESEENAVKQNFFCWVFQFIYWKSYVLWNNSSSIVWNLCVHFFNKMLCLSFTLYVVAMVHIISMNICVCLSNWIEICFFFVSCLLAPGCWGFHVFFFVPEFHLIN